MSIVFEVFMIVDDTWGGDMHSLLVFLVGVLAQQRGLN